MNTHSTYRIQMLVKGVCVCNGTEIKSIEEEKTEAIVTGSVAVNGVWTFIVKLLQERQTKQNKKQNMEVWSHARERKEQKELRPLLPDVASKHSERLWQIRWWQPAVLKWIWATWRRVTSF